MLTKILNNLWFNNPVRFWFVLGNMPLASLDPPSQTGSIVKDGLVRLYTKKNIVVVVFRADTRLSEKKPHLAV